MQKRFFVGLSLLVIAFGILTFVVLHMRETPSVLTVTFLDVGQGDAILIQAPNKKTVLIDGGPDGSILYELSHVLPIWQRSISLMIPTHDDKDHIGGLSSVLERYAVRQILDTTTFADTSTAEVFASLRDREGASVMMAVAGSRVVVDPEHGVWLEILHPVDGSIYEDRNNGSTIIKLVYGERSFLFTGDAGRGIERLVMSRYGEAVDVDVLKLGHHGSKTSSDPAFLKATSPLYGVVSAGKNNRYGHPHREVVRAVQQVGAHILYTWDDRVVCETDGIFLTCE